MYMFKSFLTFVFLVFLLASNTVSGSHYELSKQFLNFGNGAINLDKVTYIRHTLKYIITLLKDSESDLLKEYGPVATKSNIESTLRFLNYRSLAKVPFYFIRIQSSVFFDDFELSMLMPKNFLKLPKPEQVRKTQSKYSTLIKLIEKVSQSVYSMSGGSNSEEQYMNLLK